MSEDTIIIRLVRILREENLLTPEEERRLLECIRREKT